ncbi:MAG: ATP-binding protein [Butyrivibrio sp.]|nr:ATP-binding protein [Butyrivibrio sp.]
MRVQDLIIYRDFEDAELLKKMALVMDRKGDTETERDNDRRVLFECIYKLTTLSGSTGLYGNLWHAFLTVLLVNNENAYSRACELRGAVSGTINDIALHDIAIFKELFDYDFTELMETLNLHEFELVLDYEDYANEKSIYNKRIKNRIMSLSEELSQCESVEDMKAAITSFYRDYGVGRMGLHKAFRIREEADGSATIQPISNIRNVYLNDLVGYEIAKKKLVDNTEAFVEGRVANNCLLYGDAGTGKSSCIKAIANEYFDRGLRVIELYKHQLKSLNDVIDQIKGRNYKFIICLDDLSFEEFEIEYKYLKALIEGGLEKRPENVLIYATSNRRHLIKESFKDKPAILDDDIHRNDTVQEKLSLANRFGVNIYFGKPTPQEFKTIVKTLADKNGITLSEDELYLEANKWEMSHGGLSGRTAQQFIDYLVGTNLANE